MWLVYANLALSIFMTGLIWFVQIVHYPLLERIPAEQLPSLERVNTRRTAWVVAPVMLAELLCAGWLWHAPPPEAAAVVAPALAGLLGALLATAWLSTFALQAPAHRTLEQRHDATVLRRLVSTNWIRTAAWTARSAVLTIALVRASLA
jgi:hypothetical protein